MVELARGMGRDILPLVRAAALATQDDLAHSALRTLPVFGTRAAADVLAEVHAAHPEGERAVLAWQAGQALRARGIHVGIATPAEIHPQKQFALRETYVSIPDGEGYTSAVARLQDQFGVWYALLVLWEEETGIQDGFIRPFSRQEWEERIVRGEVRGLSYAPCPPDYARWQVRRARTCGEGEESEAGQALRDWDDFVGEPPPDYTPPNPLEKLRKLPAVEQQALREAAAELVARRETTRWLLEVEACEPFARRWSPIWQRAHAEGLPDPSSLPEHQELVMEATTALIDERTQRRLRGRLLDLAQFYEFRKEPRLCLIAAAAAEGIQDGVPPTESPFLRELARTNVVVVAVLLDRGHDLEELRGSRRPRRRRA